MDAQATLMRAQNANGTRPGARIAITHVRGMRRTVRGTGPERGSTQHVQGPRGAGKNPNFPAGPEPINYSILQYITVYYSCKTVVTLPIDALYRSIPELKVSQGMPPYTSPRCRAWVRYRRGRSHQNFPNEFPLSRHVEAVTKVPQECCLPWHRSEKEKSSRARRTLTVVFQVPEI